MTQEQRVRVEQIIGKYWVDNGAKVDPGIMIFDMTQSRPMSAAILCGLIGNALKPAELKEKLETIRNRTIEECARQAYNDASIEAAILGLRKGVSK